MENKGPLLLRIFDPLPIQIEFKTSFPLFPLMTDACRISATVELSYPSNFKLYSYLIAGMYLKQCQNSPLLLIGSIATDDTGLN